MADFPPVASRAKVRRPPRRTHNEHHFAASDTVRDVIIGMSDGLTVPFALAAGISGAIAASHIVVTAGIAELAAGGISMGLGGYLAARSDVDHYENERRREYAETHDVPDEERREIEAIFASYGIAGDALKHLTDDITSDRKRWVDFMMKFELGLDQPDPRRAPLSAARIGGSYVVGGLLPLLPYMLIPQSQQALWGSVAVTFVALLVFGGLKGRFTGASIVRSALETVAIGGIAAAVAFVLARLVAGGPIT
ncbi:MAG: VIT1/CCC1 transporter family protein [Candidatus Lustribacter sp.]